MNDNDIKNIFFNENGRIDSNKLTHEYIINHKEIFEYLNVRYSDSLSIRETLRRIYNNIEIRPVCNICGSPVHFIGKRKMLYTKTCGKGKCYCKERDKIMLKKYGITNFGGTKESVEKIKKTKLERYGDPYFNNIEKTKQTCLERYGNPYSNNPESVKKTKKTKLERYGNPSYVNPDKAKQTCLERYGVDNYRKTQECLNKILETKRKHNTINSSDLEKNTHIWLNEIFGKNNIIVQYKDNRYRNPKNNHYYHCDLYKK